MGKINFLWNNLADAAATTLTSSSAATEWPLANLRTIWPNYPTRTSSLGSPDYWAWDLGSALSVSYVVLWNHNFTAGATVKLQADVHAAHWADVDLALTYGTHWNDDILVYRFSTPITTCRYWRIICTDGANPDSDLSANRAFLGTGLQPYYSFARQTPLLVDPSLIGFSSNGSLNALKRTGFAGWSYDFAGVKEADFALIRTMYRAVGKNTPLFLVSDPAALLTKTEYVRFAADLSFPPVTKGFYSLKIDVETLR